MAKKADKFWFAIGFDWDEDEVDEDESRLGFCTFHNSQILDGTAADAKEYLKYAKDNFGNHKYKIYKLNLEK